MEGTFINETLGIFGMSLDDVQMGLDSSETVESGILGIGFDSGEAGIHLNNMTAYPNLVSQLFLGGYINSRSYSIWLDDHSKCHAVRDRNVVDQMLDQMLRPAVYFSAELMPQNTVAICWYYQSWILLRPLSIFRGQRYN